MKEFKGTKGKWYADIHPTGYCTVLSELNDGGTIAEVGDGTYWGNGSEIAKANAQLIAAAPDLLEALRVCFRSLCTYGSHPIVENQVKNAINKALGL